MTALVLFIHSRHSMYNDAIIAVVVSNTIAIMCNASSISLITRLQQNCTVIEFVHIGALGCVRVQTSMLTHACMYPCTHTCMHTYWRHMST